MIIKQNGACKILYGLNPPSDQGKPLNEIDNRPNLAEIDARNKENKDIQDGKVKVQYAQPSIQPTVK